MTHIIAAQMFDNLRNISLSSSKRFPCNPKEPYIHINLRKKAVMGPINIKSRRITNAAQSKMIHTRDCT
jgi:hypothetical protein